MQTSNNKPVELGVVPLAEAPTDARGELELPAELALLADQLRCEAVQLAERYPAGDRVPEIVVAVRSPGSRLPYRWALSAGLVAVVLTTAFLTVVAGRRGDRVAVPQPNLLPSSVPVAETHASPPESPPDAPPRSHTITTLPVSVLDQVSGPELEGLLDLLEAGAERPDDVSI